MSLTLQALSVTMTFDEPVDREDDLDLALLPVFPMGVADGFVRGHSTVKGIDYSEDGHTVTLVLDVGDIAILGPDDGETGA